MTFGRGIILLALGQTFVWAALYYVFPAMLLRWEAEQGWSRAEITGAITVAVLISGLAAPFAGRLIDRGQGAPLMTASAFLAAGGMLALSQVQSIAQFYLIWAINGLAMSGLLYDACFSVVTRALGARARPAITAITLIAGFAGTISFPLASLAAEAFGWRISVALAAGVIIGIGLPLNWFGLRALPIPETTGSAGEGSGQTRSRSGHLRHRAFWFLALGFACAALIHGSTLHHLLPFLDERSVAPALAVTIAALIGPSQVAGRIVMVMANRLVSTHAVTIGAFVLMGVSVSVLLLGGGQTTSLYAFVLIFGGAYGTVSILRPVLAREILGQANFGAKAGSLTLFYLSGSALAPYLGALVWTIGGYGLMFSVSTGLAALGAAFYVTAHRSRPSSQ